MIDFARVKVISGRGGDGAGSFVHTKGKRRGKADGGDGGAGGNVYIVAGAHLNTLEPFRFIKEYKAQNGGNGLSSNRKGAQAQDLEVKVPVGTQVRITRKAKNVKDGDLPIIEKTKRRGGEVTYESDFLDEVESYDLVELGQKILIARGGSGARGNAHMRDELGRRPFKGELGHEGETLELVLELKLIADVGLVGLPNAGKSTLIAAITGSNPKIAPYPFTTLEPNLGVMIFRDQRIVFADIPGLIEGASDGKGLGDTFLRHIERTKIIVHMIDAQTPDAMADYLTIRGELKAYSGVLTKKKEIIVLNKVDVAPKELVEKHLEEFKRNRKSVLCISALEKSGLELLTKNILKKLV